MKTQKYQIVGRDTVLELREQHGFREGIEKPNIVTASELNRIRESSSVTATDAVIILSQQQAASEAERRERDLERKKRMVEADKLNKTCDFKSEIECENEARKKMGLVRAKQALDEELDEVKRMNRLIAFAKVQTILDLQKEEKREMRRQEEERKNAIESIMESERVRALSLMDERENEREKAQRERAIEILGQIKERESRKLNEEENIAKERLHILKHMAEEKVRQEKHAEEKRESQILRNAEVLEFNAMAMQAQKAEEERIRSEDEAILEYQRRKDLKSREREESMALEAKRREDELFKLRSCQERAQDKAVELDALKAKRAIERAEREARKKEIEEKERVEKINASLAEARRIQHAEKQLMAIEEARLEKQEFDRMKRIEQQLESREKKIREVEKQKREEHARELRLQMEAKHEKALQEKKDALEEGNIVRKQLHAEAVRLNEIRKEKLGLIIKSGVAEKHCMAFKKII